MLLSSVFSSVRAGDGVDGYIGVDCYYLCVLLRTIILRDDASIPEISVAKSARFNELGNIILLVIYCCTLNAKVGSLSLIHI